MIFDQRNLWTVAWIIAFCILSGSLPVQSIRADSPPNIVYIMSDELAYFELGLMGNPRIRTPNIDRFAREGLQFTNALAGSPVCAPLRCTLMTGRHAGHASVRANDGGTPLRADEVTIATLLREQGYATGGFGKWGCGGRDSTGVPEKHGFDVFYGYYDQVHAHSYYPPYLIRNSEEVTLTGNSGGREGETYSHYEIMQQALEFIRTNRDRPFFCYLPITPPHGMYDIPADDPAWHLYREDAWMKDPNISQDAKNYAAMVSMVDRNVGEVLELLRELDLEENTIVFFTGDNGGQDRFSSQEFPRGFFGPNVNPQTGEAFRGGKGNLYEGGLKIPFFVRWPGKIAAGRVSDFVFYQPDILPTLVELVNARMPNEIDGMSILPEILGADAVGRKQAEHEFLYWEFGQQVAVRQDNWKAIRPGNDRPWELYDLSQDAGESHDIAARHPVILAKLQEFAEQSHEPVNPGIYLDEQRTLHEKDRRAKWGNRRRPSSASSTQNRLEADSLIPADEIALVSFSSENESNQRLAKYAIDMDPDTVWHSQFTRFKAKHPHELILDLGKSRRVSGFRYLARQDGGWNGAFKETHFFVSDDPKSFGEPIVKATFAKVRKPQVAACEEPVQGRYVRILVLSEVNDGIWASAADIGVAEAKE